MTESFHNRRKHARIYRNFILSYHLKGQVELHHDISQINNISKGGMSFITTQPFEPGVEIVVYLKTPFIADSIQIEGVVLDSREKIASLLYEVRVQFNALSDMTSEVLDRVEHYHQEGSV